MSSPFWSYFHDKLNWLPIFRPGPLSAIMKGLALHLDDVRSDILWLREQWNPVSCESWLVEKYGQSRGIWRNRFDTDEAYRRRVIYAYTWHKLGGKVRGLERILLENGFSTKVLQASRKELWAHFRVWIDVNRIVFDRIAAQLSWFLANEYKPARSKIEYFITAIDIPLEEHVGIGVCGASHAKSPLYFEPPEKPRLNSFTGLGVTGRTSSRSILYFNPSLPEISRKSRMGIGGRTSCRLATCL